MQERATSSSEPRPGKRLKIKLSDARIEGEQVPDGTVLVIPGQTVTITLQMAVEDSSKGAAMPNPPSGAEATTAQKEDSEASEEQEEAETHNYGATVAEEEEEDEIEDPDAEPEGDTQGTSPGRRPSQEVCNALH